MTPQQQLEAQQVEEAAKLRAAGVPVPAIAARLGITTRAVYRRLARVDAAEQRAAEQAAAPPPADDQPAPIASYARSIVRLALQRAVEADRRGDARTAQAWLRHAAPYARIVARVEEEPDTDDDPFGLASDGGPA